MRAMSLVMIAILAGCAEPNGSPDAGEPELNPAGLQYSGAVALSAAAASRNGSEVSAPILPDARVWQYKGGSGYPPTQPERLTLVRDATYTYAWLLTECQPHYPAITITTGAPLTPEQLAINYDQVARCAYDRYGAKPYWVPKIVDDVDVCAEKLGTGWRLISESDLSAFDEADFQFLEETLSLARGTDPFPREFYFALLVYARAADGTLKLGNLAPGAVHLSPLPIAAGEELNLYIGNGSPIGLRCIR